MKKLSATIAKHKLAVFGGGGAAGLAYWHYRMTGSWLPSSFTGSGSGQQYTPGQQAPFDYLPGGVEPVNTNGGYSTGGQGGGTIPWWILKWLFPKGKPPVKRTPKPRKHHKHPIPKHHKHPHKPHHPVKKPKRHPAHLRHPRHDPAKKGSHPGQGLYHKGKHKHRDVRHRHHDEPDKLKSHNTDRTKHGMTRGNTIRQRPHATTTGGGHPIVQPAPRPSAPPPRNIDRQGRKK